MVFVWLQVSESQAVTPQSTGYLHLTINSATLQMSNACQWTPETISALSAGSFPKLVQEVSLPAMSTPVTVERALLESKPASLWLLI